MKLSQFREFVYFPQMEPAGIYCVAYYKSRCGAFDSKQRYDNVCALQT